jgi:DNA-binding transcriptional MerR regulator
MMSNQAPLQPPQAVTQSLDISAATLRRWSDEFADYLSPEANPAGKGHRRYTAADIETLRSIKELMNQGLTYEQVWQQLSLREAVSGEEVVPGQFRLDEPEIQRFKPAVGRFDPVEANPDEERSLIASNGNESPAIAFLTNTLATLSDTQQSILNSQAANRELLGVLIQDNFNLKEENNRLRERILEIERSLAQLHRDEEWRREALRQELDAKISLAQQNAAEAIRTAQSIELPEIKAIKGKSGCLGALLGGSDTQIVAVPRKRKPETRPATTSAPAATRSQYGPAPGQAPPAHPKPTAPPE